MQQGDLTESLEEIVGIRERAKVLLLGVFHFAYPNLDAFKHEEKVEAKTGGGCRGGGTHGGIPTNQGCRGGAV